MAANSGRVKLHELIVAALVGAVFGLLGYYITRRIQGPVEILVKDVGL